MRLTRVSECVVQLHNVNEDDETF